MRMFIDDERVPQKEYFDIVVRNYEDAISYFDSKACPAYISFDNDLGEEKEGYDIAKYLIEKDMDMDGNYIPKDFRFNVHSANPIAVKNITKLLISYFQTVRKGGFI